jgi:hypothetical protein
MSAQAPSRPPRPSARARRRLAKAGRVASVGLSVALHGAALLALLHRRPEPPAPVEAPPMTAELVDLAPTVTPPAAAPPTPLKAAPPPTRVRAARNPPAASTLAADEIKATDTGPGLTEAQLAGAASADAGPPGGPCDMARWLQSALRKDPLVQAAVSRAAGKALMVWDGDWVQSGGEDGKGLAAVREAIMWQIAFAPAACRAGAVHGLVLLSMNGAAGSPRLAVGAGDWRWSDLLKSRSTYSGEGPIGR